MSFIKDSHLQILLALMRYKFLSVAQIQELQTGLNNYRWIGEILREMKRKKWVGSTDAPMARKKLLYGRRLGSLYFLEKRGLGLIEEVYDFKTNIKCSKTTSTHDYFHRKETVSFQIHLDHFMDTLPLEVGCWERYFDKVGGNRGTVPLEAMTKIGDGSNYIIPDIVFSLHKEESIDERLLFCVEVSMCDQHGYSKPMRIVDKVKNYIQAIQSETISKKYRLSILGGVSAVTPRMLFTFETDQFMYDACQKICMIKGFKNYSELFYFTTLSSLQQNFGNCWHRLDRQEAVNFITGNPCKKRHILSKEKLPISERILAYRDYR